MERKEDLYKNSEKSMNSVLLSEMAQYRKMQAGKPWGPDEKNGLTA